MRYDDKDQESQNVDDRRGQGGMMRGGSGLPGGMLGGLKLPLPLLIIAGLVMFALGMNPLDLLTGGGNMPQMPQMDGGRQAGSQAGGQRSPFEVPGMPGAKGQQRTTVARADDDMARFVKLVLKDTEDVWEGAFQQFGKRYVAPQLVIFDRATQTGCGTGQTAMGPFYCPVDQKVYIDLAFYKELKERFQAPGDFAQAYVIAHEVGHHVQNLLGIADKVQNMKQRLSERQSNALQVRMELQADCLAGVWAALNQHVKNRMQPGDVEEGLNAASRIGDDMIQRQTQGRVMPEAFTHGSSEQRVRWFRRGMETGQIQQCDTFNAQDL
jgi:uncharacterized protein